MFTLRLNPVYELMRAGRSHEKHLLRKNRAIRLERRYQHLRIAMFNAAVFTGGAVAVMMSIQLLDAPVPGVPSAGPLQQPILRHYAFVIAVVATGFLGGAFAFRFLARASQLPALRLLWTGAGFAVMSHLSFMPSLEFAGLVGSIIWLSLLAIGTAVAGAHLLFPIGR